MQEAATKEVAAAPRTGATLILGLLALALSIVGWTHVDRDAFVIDQRAFWAEPWRLFAAAFAHEHVGQLVVGLAGLWFFGRALERRFGSLRMITIFALFALGIGLAEYAFDRGESGFVGVLFGLWALLTVANRRSPTQRGWVWILLSLLMSLLFLATLLVSPHMSWGLGAGICFGALAAAGLDEPGIFKQPFVPLAATVLVLLASGATVWRTTWNFGGASVEYDRAGFDALERGDKVEAERLLRLALAFNDRDGKAWWNLCCVLDRLERKEEAADAGWRAYENSGFDREQLTYLENILRRLRDEHVAAGESKQAFACATRVARLAANDLTAWETVRELADQLGEDDWYDRADRECTRLSPETK